MPMGFTHRYHKEPRWGYWVVFTPYTDGFHSGGDASLILPIAITKSPVGAIGGGFAQDVSEND